MHTAKVVEFAANNLPLIVFVPLIVIASPLIAFTVSLEAVPMTVKGFVEGIISGVSLK